MKKNNESVKNVGVVNQVAEGVFRLRSKVGQCFQFQIDGKKTVNVFRWNHVWRKWVLAGSVSSKTQAVKDIMAGKYNLALTKERVGR